jgi:riboflavin synthase
VFTGIVQSVGRIVSVKRGESGLRLGVDAGSLDLTDVATGDSIAIQGVCLTVVARRDGKLEFDVSPETLSVTVGLDAEGNVNLEKAMRLSDRLGGHLVQGHVDGVGVVRRFETLADGNVLLEVEAPAAISRYIARKGSIAVDGVSLTTNRVEGNIFTINLIPHTLAATTLRRLQPGRKVNLEVDLLARYVERMQGFDEA